MSEGKPGPALTPKAAAAKAEREARLARALRENLRKRKQQDRERGVPTQGRPDTDAPEPPRE